MLPTIEEINEDIEFANSTRDKVLLNIEKHLVKDIHKIQKEIEWLIIIIEWNSLVKEEGSGIVFITIRLRYFDNDWDILVGDPEYDTDHRGYWGHSYFGKDSNPREVAEDLFYDLRLDLYF